MPAIGEVSSESSTPRKVRCVRRVRMCVCIYVYMCASYYLVVQVLYHLDGTALRKKKKPRKIRLLLFFSLSSLFLLPLLSFSPLYLAFFALKQQSPFRSASPYLICNLAHRVTLTLKLLVQAVNPPVTPIRFMIKMAARDKTTTIPQQLEPFYTQLLAQSFPTSASAIDACRSLCAQYGFTVKQESSTHRNIYVYCSREGLADSVRNPKVNPKRKRPSKRCDCKWRVVLNENKETQMWRFRKSNNPEALTHNHPLMKPEEIERGWPKEVHDTICQLARGFLQTHEIRQRVQLLFPEITWNERRFYNRLSEERQKIRQESTTVRAQQLTTTWSKVCMAAAGCEELAEYAQTQLMQMLNTICTMAQIPVDSLGEPPVLSSEDEDDPISVPKGFAVVVIPEHTYLVKVHSQRTIQKKRKCMSPMLPPSQPFTQLPPHHSHAVSAPSTAVATATETTATATAPPPPPPPQMANYMVYPPPMHVPYYPVQEEDMVYPPLDTSSVTSSPSPASSSTPPPPAATFMTHATDRLIPQPAKRRRSSHMTFPYSLVYQQRPSSPMNGAGVHKCSAAHVPATTIPHGISPQHSPQRLSSQPVSVALTADPTRHNHQIPCYDNNYW